MDKVFWLIPQKLAGRPGPDTEPWDLASLREGGIRAVLSVNDGRMCNPKDFHINGINYACIPFPKNIPPINGDEEICLSVLPEAYTFVKSEIDKGHGVLIHCSAGKDRTGLFLSYFLMQENPLSPNEAIKAIRKVRPIALTSPGWEELAQKVLGNHYNTLATNENCDQLTPYETYGYSSPARSILSTRTAERQAAFILSHLKEDMKILDIGCGNGSITNGLSKYVPQGSVIGVDISDIQIAEAKEESERLGLRNVSYIKTDLLKNWVYSDSSIGAIYSHTVMSQIPDPQHIVNEAHRTLIDGGFIAFREPYYGHNIYLNHTARKKYHCIYEQVMHLNGGNVSVGMELPQYLKNAGFSKIQVIPKYSSTWEPEDRLNKARKYAEMTRKAAFMDQAEEMGWITSQDRQNLANDLISEAQTPYGVVSFCMIEVIGWKENI